MIQTIQLRAPIAIQRTCYLLTNFRDPSQRDKSIEDLNDLTRSSPGSSPLCGIPWTGDVVDGGAWFTLGLLLVYL
jgi:hypothetical protein